MDEAGSASPPGEILDDNNNGAPAKRRPGRPEAVPLEPYKDLIIQLFSADNVPIIDIARQLNLEHGLDISERTISRRLTSWGVPRKKLRVPASQDLRDRLLYHYNRNLNDEEITAELVKEGFDMKTRNLSRLRQKLGMRRRSKYPEFREFSEEADEAASAQLAAESAGQQRPSPVKKKKAPKPKKEPHNAALIPKVSSFVEKYMSKYDGSHDFNHIRRVVGLAHLIYKEILKEAEEELLPEPDLDLHVITLAALLHDVGDKKYLEPGQDANTLVLATLLSFGAPEDLAIKVQRIVLGVSYSTEMKEDAATTLSLIQKYPELAVVQDADRLDAIGAVGIGRTFTFGGAKGAANMGETIQHFSDKLERLESLMKTGPGRRFARERTERLLIFKSWWEEEQREAEGILKRS